MPQGSVASNPALPPRIPKSLRSRSEKRSLRAGAGWLILKNASAANPLRPAELANVCRNRTPCDRDCAVCPKASDCVPGRCWGRSGPACRPWPPTPVRQVVFAIHGGIAGPEKELTPELENKLAPITCAGSGSKQVTGNCASRALHRWMPSRPPFACWKTRPASMPAKEPCSPTKAATSWMPRSWRGTTCGPEPWPV